MGYQINRETGSGHQESRKSGEEKTANQSLLKLRRTRTHKNN